MRIRCTIFWAIFLALMLPAAARAAAQVYLEPTLGFERGKYFENFSISSPATTRAEASTVSSFDFGLRFGAIWAKTFSLGVDYIGSFPNVGDSTNMNNNVGAFAMIRFTRRFQLSYSYFISSTIKRSSATLSGHGNRLGIGFIFWEGISANLDWISRDMDLKSSAEGYAVSHYNLSGDAALLTFSLPLMH